MGRTVIVAYRPKPGSAGGLSAAVAKHLRVLRSQGLVSDRAAFVMRARDGTLLEVFEWKSAEAIAQAHSNEAVAALWQEFSQVCDYVPVGTVAESMQLFSEFESVDV